jgi:hypothetical protein
MKLVSSVWKDQKVSEMKSGYRKAEVFGNGRLVRRGAVGYL